MIFIENKYTKYYYRIVDNAKSRNLVSRDQAKLVLGYVELHHIIPRSLGGSDDGSNLVFLTAREHIILHLLLTKMTTGKQRSKMVLAAFSMSVLESSNQNRYRLTSRNYAYVRESLSTIQSAMMSGSNNPMYGKEITESHRSNLKAAAQARGRPTREAINARAESNRGQTRTEKTKRRLKEAWATREYSECVHCSGKFSPGMFSRWHGDKCRYKNLL